MTGLAVDADQIASFVNALFRHASPGQMVALRSFVEGESRPFRITVAELGDAGLEPVIKAACCLAQSAANADSPTVFCPPVAGFANLEDPWRAREKDLKEAFALSVECDQRPFGARGLLEELLGPATVVVASGGEWTNPITGDIEPKLHLHWRLSRPAAGDHLAVLKEARRLATTLAGGDPSNIPAVHPIRWPGTWHRKGQPRLARIVDLRQEREVHLFEAFGKLQNSRPQTTLEKSTQSDRGSGPAGDDRGAAVLVRISLIQDSCFAKSRTLVSESRGQLGREDR